MSNVSGRVFDLVRELEEELEDKKRELRELRKGFNTQAQSLGKLRAELRVLQQNHDRERMKVAELEQRLKDTPA